MITKLLSADAESLKIAAEILKKGGLVAFPTETVYGLGANALNGSAVEKIFQAKGRPQDNPLIVHVCNREMFETVAHINNFAHVLISRLMPSSLTLVLKKKQIVPDVVTAKLDTVAVRMPNNTHAIELIKCAGLPIAAPSANSSTRPSPTTAAAVLADMEGKIPLILDGGKCEVGIESTVLDLTTDTPTILRQGIVTKSELESVLGVKVLTAGETAGTVKSPGMKYRHYAPNCAVLLNTDGCVETVNGEFLRQKEAGKRVCIMCCDEQMRNHSNKETLSLGVNATQAAERLYGNLLLAERNYDCLIVVWTDKTEIGMSVLNRLSKACGGNLI